MDPNRVLADIRAAAFQVSEYFAGNDDEKIEEIAERLKDSIETLDEWISNGGFLPREWSENR